MQDFKDAMKDKNEIKKNTIMMIRAAILQIEKDTQKELDETAVTEVIAKELKKRKDSIGDFEKSGRQDLLSQLNEEITIIKGYLPEELSAEELENIIKETITEVGATSMKDMGKVMQAVKGKTAGRAEGKVINEIVKRMLE
jgi:uncharacterized protein YqeY